MKGIKEITPLRSDDPFVILKHNNANFDYPLHFHPEYEINFIINFTGKRIVGDSIEDCENIDLVLLGPYLQHIWKSEVNHENTTVITIQFQENFLGTKLSCYSMFNQIKDLLELSKRGISFSGNTKEIVGEKIQRICETSGLDTFLLFLEILRDLAKTKDQKILSRSSFDNSIKEVKSRRINAVIYYIKNNYEDNIKLGTLAEIANMSESAFSHFFKKRTNKSFTQYILDYRIGVATKLLLETEMAISEISYKSGFKTLSNFNRTFKKKQGLSPKAYKIKYANDSSHNIDNLNKLNYH